MSENDDVQCPICGSLTERRNVTEVLGPSESAAPAGSPTDAAILDWLQTHCRMDWPFGNEIQVAARCLSLHAFKNRPTLREAVSAAIKSENEKLKNAGPRTPDVREL